jgi:hypothetical protein
MRTIVIPIAFFKNINLKSYTCVELNIKVKKKVMGIPERVVKLCVTVCLPEG